MSDCDTCPATTRAKPASARDKPVQSGGWRAALDDQDVERWARAFATTRASWARDRAVAAGVPLARGVVRRYRWRPSEREDAEQVALAALLGAVERYDATVGAFRPFAVRTVEGALKRYRRDHGWGVRPSRPVQQLYLRCAQAGEELTAALGRLPRAEEIAAVVGAPLEDVEEALRAASYRSLASLDGLPDADDTGWARLREDRPADAAVLLWALQRLSEADRTLLRLRFGNDLTQSEIAARLGCSQMQVSRRLDAVVGRLRDLLDEPGVTIAARPRRHRARRAERAVRG